MAYFDNLLGADESLFKDIEVLEYAYMPKLIPFREGEQKEIANTIKPLFMDRTGRNLLIHGRPGIGKTLACKNVVQELEEKEENIEIFYINCWQKNTSYKMVLEMCELLGYRFTQNKRAEELFEIVKGLINIKSAVFIFDEVDKVQDIDILYNIVDEIKKKAIILITNHKDWIHSLDNRIKSRLVLSSLEFKEYNKEEIKQILKERMQYAFSEGVWKDDAFSLCCEKTADARDVRVGLYIMKESGNLAEEDSSKKIETKHVEKAIKKISEFKPNEESDLEPELEEIYKISKENFGKKIGDIFKIYQDNGGSLSYKSFQRKIKKLSDGKFISLERLTGKEGNTTIIKQFAEENRKLTDF